MFQRYVCVRQSDTSSDCGAAALATIARFHGVAVSLEQLRDLSGTDRIGTTLSGLRQAAETLGFSAKGIKAPYEALAQVPLPALAHFQDDDGLGHFVVVYEVRKNAVVIADPARGMETLPAEVFRQRWTGRLLLVVPDHTASHQRAGKTPAAPSRRFLHLIGRQASALIEACLCALLMTVLGVASSYFIQHLVDSVLVRQDAPLLNALALGMVLVIVFRTLFGTLRQYLVAHLTHKAHLAVAVGYARHVLRLPLQFFEMRRAGDLLSRVADGDKIREAIGETVLTVIVDGVLVALMLALLWLYDPALALVATAFAPVIVLCVLSHQPLTRQRSREAMERAELFYSQVIEDIAGIETVKAFGAERARADRAESRLVRLAESIFSLRKLAASLSAMGTFVTSMVGLVVLWYGSYRVMAGALSVGQLMFFYTLLNYLFGPLERVASVHLQLQEALVAVDRLGQVMDAEPEQSTAHRKQSFEGLRQGIQLEQVSFKYGSRANVLERVDVRIPVGQTVAIVGESGSGKSSLLKLLMGFYHPTDGRILVDGSDMRDLSLASWREHIGWVSQDPFVFNATIEENIAFGRPDATLADVIDAARAAGLDEFIGSLPKRYDTLLGERAGNLSGGQRQRLAIARALVRRPEIVIFDEATSHLDTSTERAIQENLRTTLAGKTVVLVAHRLSTVMHADLIYVLRHGRIVEQGTHRQLLAANGWYAALCQGQTDDERSVVPASRRNGHALASQELSTHAY